MSQIKAADVSKLRKMIGAGMMDCKKALVEAEGDFDKAVEIIRKKGQAIANKRADRDASEGVVLAKVSEDGKKGAMIVLNCETDFVAKNDDFVKFAQGILTIAINEYPNSLEELKQLQVGGKIISELLIEQTGVVGEKIDLSFFDKIDAEEVVPYIHAGNKLATLVGLNKAGFNKAGKDIAMQIAAMNPVALDKDGISEEIIQKEIEIGKDQARQEGKPEELLEKIAMGKLNKFYKENTLLNQEFVKEGKKTVKQYLQESDKDLTVTGFKRFTLNA